MEIKVREVNEVESKSTQQVEQELLEKHEAEVNGDAPAQEEATVEEPAGLSEDDVRSFLSERYGREITSLDELNEARETAPELPEDVAAYYKYKQETGRGLEDFIKVNRNLDEADGDSLLKEYLLITEDGLDAEDVEMMMDDYKYDEDLDDAQTHELIHDDRGHVVGLGQQQRRLVQTAQRRGRQRIGEAGARDEHRLVRRAPVGLGDLHTRLVAVAAGYPVDRRRGRDQRDRRRLRGLDTDRRDSRDAQDERSHPASSRSLPARSGACRRVGRTSS